MSARRRSRGEATGSLDVFGLGGCDATIVALAEDLGGRWLTADEKPTRRFESARWQSV